ncbi:MAG: hypothetical protein EBV30_10765, partial [Actinobacteria bacterium]|nr:hypothetical protein [Actinomycetota bacterium]
MALKTPNIGLIKPNNGEYENVWDIAINKNSDLLDGAISDIQSELLEARGDKSSLDERISVSLNSDGTINNAKSEFYVSNDYMFKFYEKYPNLFVPVISVHPYRRDAVKELEKWAKKGVKWIKWLPNAQGID